MKLSSIITTTTVSLTLLSMTSCGIYKKYETPTDNALTAAYKEARENPVDSTAFGNLMWEQVFTDPQLVDLINMALAENKSLSDAQLNVEIANAQLKGARLAYLPSVTFSPNGAGASYAGSSLAWSYQLPLSVSWEVDIFGKLLNSKRGAQVAVARSEAYAQAVRSQLIAAVANTYYAISAVEAQLELSRNTAVLWNESVNTMRSLKEAGRTTEAAVVQSDANYRSVLASIADLEVSLHQLNNTMSLLLNRMPQQWAVPVNAHLNVPSMLVNGVPMSYLAMRPDVAAAEQGLAAAYYTTASARAAFYQLAGSLVAPLFSRGQNIARLEAAKAQQKQAMNAFETAVLSAAGEVSDALTVYEKAGVRAQHLDQQVKDLEQSVQYTNDLLIYSNGTYLEVLTAQQSLLSAQMNRISCQLTRDQAVVNLYQAMGGGR
jgi:outer membrane protein TolC